MNEISFLEVDMAKISTQLSEHRAVLADAIPLKAPFSIQVEVSQLCNIKCNYCMQSFIKQKDNAMMSMDLFIRLCDEIGMLRARLKSVNFAGWGEPLMNKYLPAMIRHLHVRTTTDSIAVITNGLLLAPPTSRALVDAGTNHIRVSLQGITSKAYLKTCGKKIDFKKFVSQIRFLYKNKKDCQIYVKVADVALEPGEEEKFYEIFDPICDRMFVEKIRPMFKENESDGKLVSKYGGEHPPVICCPQPFYMVGITACGDILPCCSYYDPTRLGNISDKSLRGIWGGEGLKFFQRMMLLQIRKAQASYPVCKTCLMPDAIITPGDCLDDKAEEIRGRLCAPSL